MGPVGSSMLATTIDSQSLNVSAYAFIRPEKDRYGVVPKNTSFTGSVALSPASITGLIIQPSSTPLPTPAPTPAPGPPPPVAKCCFNGGCSKCHDPGWCTATKDNCESHCAGKWCPPQNEVVV